MTTGRQLSYDEWKDATLPMFWRRPPKEFKWTKTDIEIALKWLAGNVAGWFYFADDTFIFERSDDAVMFELWIEPNPLRQEKGSI